MAGWQLFWLWGFALVTGTFSYADIRPEGVTSETEWTEGERDRVDQWLERFYANPRDATLMNERAEKFSASSNDPIEIHAFLKLKDSNIQNPLLRLAQVKGTSSFIKYRATKHPRFSKRRLKDWATIEANDRVGTLAQGWLSKDAIVYDLDNVPTAGISRLSLWSDDYWRYQWGALSYRYAFAKKFKHYKEAIADYVQPLDWKTLLDLNTFSEEIIKRITRWSPAEKYDLTVGDESFSFTQSQKHLGQEYADQDGDVEEWMGVCDGWASASLRVPNPKKPVTLLGARGIPVEWYAEDIRALVSAAWSQADVDSNFIGGRCDKPKMEIYGNGRLVAQDCFDTNPASFHLALANLVGKAQASFIMDSSYDYEVWNQPIQSYRFIYFNPLNPSRRSRDWRKVAVDYDEKFKENDRFQNPLTRGTRIKKEKWDDKGIKQIVGVVATVVYIDELDPPLHQPTAQKNKTVRVNYLYDLELTEKKGRLIPMGGEWFQNAHPDFLWIPKAKSLAFLPVDKKTPLFNGHAGATDEFTRHAKKASRENYPLCRVVKSLVEESSGSADYLCPE